MDLFDYKPKMEALHGEQLPDSVRNGQRLTGMTANQSSFPLANSFFKFNQHGKSGAWISELMPHTAKIADELCFIKSMHTEAINHDPAITFFQTGSQQRSYANFRRGVEIVRNGLIGKVTRVEVGLPAGHEDSLDSEDVTTPPANLNYDAWCGPSEKLPFIHARHHRNWRWHLAYGGGQLMDWIGHHNDIAHWGLGLDKTGPVEVESIGWTKPKTPIYNAPVDFAVHSRYAGGVSIEISTKHTKGTKWIGTDGWVYVNRGTIEASNNDWLRAENSLGKYRAYASDDHTRNFLELSLIHI